MKKGFILGFLCAAILFTAIGAGAYTLVPSTVKLVVDGVDVKDDTLPILYMEPGYNYVPAATFRSICDKIGVGFEYVNETATIEINTKVKETATVEPIVQEVNSMSEITEKITQTPDGITQIDTWEGKQYIGFIYIRNKVKEKGYDFAFDIKSKSWRLTKSEEIILDNVPTSIVYGGSSVEVNYYIDTMLPLIQ